MKKLILKSLLLIAGLLVSTNAMAYDFEVDGIYYNKSGSNAMITYKDSNYNSYSGDVVIPETVTYEGTTYNVTTIGSSAFSGCSGLTSIEIPNSVTTIGNDAFFDCCRLTSITIGSGVITIGNYAFFNCSGLTSIKIPNSVTSINYYAFCNCSGLTSVTINENIKEIGVGAFVNCSSLTSVTIGENVEKIGNGTFAGCSKLSIINSLNPIPPIIYSSTFNGENGLDKSTCVLNVPVGSKAVYQLAPYWNEFFNINEVDFAGIEEITIDNDVIVTVKDGNITVNGLDANVAIEVYNTSGQMLYCGTETSIPVATSGIYIVKVQNKTFKVILK